MSRKLPLSALGSDVPYGVRRNFDLLRDAFAKVYDPPTYPDSTAALAAGLKQGDFYVTPAGAVMRIP